ncbi:hypothetical protein [Halobellus ruber]|uniref:DUF8025 domain-containing protein n=1 Tax=Halobellus ruber TaxID=2761102 RepID=A0A7J9SID0_9EURY|nr:hypothetical protein [Halobellus ruber]MBB6645737.1 hypothetical protein [Halobellus ruber]
MAGGGWTDGGAGSDEVARCVAHAVDFEADYESGDLTITVERADES